MDQGKQDEQSDEPSHGIPPFGMVGQYGYCQVTIGTVFPDVFAPI
jgi:hypothetical protein